MPPTLESVLARLTGRNVVPNPSPMPNDVPRAHPPVEGSATVGSTEARESGSETPSVWAVAGAKGGVGKSLVAVGLAGYLGMTDREVLLIDGDLGAPNLHTLLGIRSTRLTLGSFIQRDVESLEETASETMVPGVRLIPGSRSLFGAANPKASQKERLLRHLRAAPADVVILDLGAGTSLHVLDLFKDAERKILVLSPEPTAIQNGYDFLRMAVYRQLLTNLGRATAPSPEVRRVVQEALEGSAESRTGNLSGLFESLVTISEDAAEDFHRLLRDFRVHLVVNTATERQARQVADAVLQISHDALGVRVDFAGHLQSDPSIARSVRKQRPFLLDCRGGDRWNELASIAEALGRPGKTAREAPAPLSETASAAIEDAGEPPESSSAANRAGEEVAGSRISHPSSEGTAETAPPAGNGNPRREAGDPRPPADAEATTHDGGEPDADEPEVGGRCGCASHAVGRNQNVPLDGKTYHVQTEDLGHPREVIRSVVYLSGRLVLSQGNPYVRFREKRGPDFTVQQMVDYQHRAVVAAITARKLGGTPEDSA